MTLATDGMDGKAPPTMDAVTSDMQHFETFCHVKIKTLHLYFLL
jgi:hypothetical protein